MDQGLVPDPIQALKLSSPAAANSCKLVLQLNAAGSRQQSAGNRQQVKTGGRAHNQKSLKKMSAHAHNVKKSLSMNTPGIADTSWLELAMAGNGWQELSGPAVALQ